MSQSGRAGRAAASATLGPATVDVGAEELEPVGDADVSVELAVVGDECRRSQLDVVAASSDAVEVLAVAVGAALVRALVGAGVPDEAVSDGRRRTVDGGSSADLGLAELVVGGGLGRPASPFPRPTTAAASCSRRPPAAVLVRLVMFQTREYPV